LAKGRFIKAAERACASKNRYDSARDAERAVEGRFRAYHCPICHHFHLTSVSGPSSSVSVEPEAKIAPPAPGPTLAALDWSALDGPKPKVSRARPVDKSSPDPSMEARAVGPCDRDHRVHLVLDGRLVKSAVVKEGLRSRIQTGSSVRVMPGKHPEILRVCDV